MNLSVFPFFTPAPRVGRTELPAAPVGSANGRSALQRVNTLATRAWRSPKRTPLLLALVLVAADRVAASFGIDLLPTALASGSGLVAFWAIGHCDTLDGPLAKLAQRALVEGNVNLVLPWVRPEDESEIRHVFDHAQAVRTLGPEARSLADRHFLETLVRVHRAGEGAAFTGLKPAGLDLGPAVPAADEALKTGAVDAVVELLVDAIGAGVRGRFKEASSRQRFDPDDVGAGRRYVEAYVPYVHYVERLWEAATGPVHGHPHEDEAHDEHGDRASHHH